jgi:multidrug efflux pump
VLGGTVALFAVSLFMMQFIKQEFFPPSLRPEIIVEMRLQEGSSLAASQAEADKMSAFLQAHSDEISNYSYYVGEGASRFVLTMEPILPQNNYAQFVVVAKDTQGRAQLTQEIRDELADNFPNVRSNIKFIQTGPPADYPIMLRVSGYDKDKVRDLANTVADQLSADDNVYGVNLDWNEKSKVVHLELDQDKLRSLGVSSQSVAQTLYTEVTGAQAAQFYTGDRTIDIDLRLLPADRQDLSQLQNLPVYLGQAGYVPLQQIAKISYDAEEGLIKRRDLKPTITVQANIKSGTANDATQKAYDATAQLRQSLPLGYSIEPDGALEDSNDSMQFLAVPLPATVLIVMTLLMFQLRSAKQMLLTILTAPLGIIGVAWGMLITGKAMGFVAILGVLALFGMIIRNTVILIDQIQKHLADGEKPWDAIVDSAILRFRPIMLTAAAAILGMVPLMTSAFWGPMAVAIASGLLVATVLTLLVLPTMYAVAYNVEKEQ